MLDRLGLTGRPPDDQPWPRLWWCLPGLLSFLPVHAAGHHGSRLDALPQTVMDRAVSSHTPTLRALALAQAREASGARSASDTEIEVIGPEISREAALSALRTAHRAHFSCPGTADVASPAGSCLHLADNQKITVADIARLRLRDAGLAYLSACAPVQAGPESADEAIHLVP